jgi:hypothetical protein
MRPSHFQHRLVLLRVKCLALGRHRDMKSKEIKRLALHELLDYVANNRSVITEPMYPRCRVIEIKDDVALVDLLHEQILAPVGRYFVESRQDLAPPRKSHVFDRLQTTPKDMSEGIRTPKRQHSMLHWSIFCMNKSWRRLGGTSWNPGNFSSSLWR